MKKMTCSIALTVLMMAGACTPSADNSTSDAVSVPAQSSYFLENDAVVTVDGVPIRYRDEGAKDAPVLVMIHGFSFSLETWDALAAELKSDYRVIRLDLPGHGLTGPDAKSRYSNLETVDFVRGFISALDLDNPVLIGNSLGGLMAWRLAAQTPDEVSRLVLIAPGGFSINGITETRAEVPMMVKLYLTKAPFAGVKQATAGLFADPSKLSDGRVTVIHDMMTQPGNGDAFVERLAQFTLPDPTEDLKTVAVPTLIIWGDKDMMVPSSHAREFEAALPDVRLKMYENMGHVPQEEAPDRVAQDIRTFLTEGTGR